MTYLSSLPWALASRQQHILEEGSWIGRELFEQLMVWAATATLLYWVFLQSVTASILVKVGAVLTGSVYSASGLVMGLFHPYPGQEPLGNSAVGSEYFG